MHNTQIAQLLNQIADLLELQQDGAIRAKAYRHAARAIEQSGPSLSSSLARGGALHELLPDVAAEVTSHITEIVNTGRCTLLKRLRRQVSSDAGLLLQLPYLGPKRVRTLSDELGIHTVDQLHAAARAGEVSALPGFGLRLEYRILRMLSDRNAPTGRFSVGAVDPIAANLLAHLNAVPGVQRAEIAGSVRRRMDSVAGIDVVVQSDDGPRAIDAFANREDVADVQFVSRSEARVVFRTGLKGSVQAVSASGFAAAWLYRTGSIAHNAGLARLAAAAGLRWDKEGLFRSGDRVHAPDEAHIYALLGLSHIPPELRENRGEIELALNGLLPRLVRRSDLRGDLHVHSHDRFGKDSILALAAHARARGMGYLAVADGADTSAEARSRAGRLSAQIDLLDRLNAGWTDFALLKSAEVDILEDGRLDLPNALLARLDMVIGRIRHGLDLSRARQTGRLLRAMDHPCFTVLAYPHMQLVGSGRARALDIRRVLQKAKDRGCFIELNGQPHRLAIDNGAYRSAKAEGVLVCIDSDAQGPGELDHLDDGIAQARRGWLEPSDVLNTRGLAELRPLLARTMSF